MHWAAQIPSNEKKQCLHCLLQIKAQKQKTHTISGFIRPYTKYMCQKCTQDLNQHIPLCINCFRGFHLKYDTLQQKQEALKYRRKRGIYKKKLKINKKNQKNVIKLKKQQKNNVNQNKYQNKHQIKNKRIKNHKRKTINNEIQCKQEQNGTTDKQQNNYDNFNKHRISINQNIQKFYDLQNYYHKDKKSMYTLINKYYLNYLRQLTQSQQLKQSIKIQQ